MEKKVDGPFTAPAETEAGEASTVSAGGPPIASPAQFPCCFLTRARWFLNRLLPALLIAGLLGWWGWKRWDPVPERPVRATDLVRQWSVTTCGPAALATLLNVYGKPWTPTDLERECQVTAAGSSLYNLRDAARRHGFWAEGLEATTPQALLRVPRPYMAYLTSGHFVVVVRRIEHRLEVFDPTAGSLWTFTPRELHAQGGGRILSISPKVPLAPFITGR